MRTLLYCHSPAGKNPSSLKTDKAEINHGDGYYRLFLWVVALYCLFRELNLFA